MKFSGLNHKSQSFILLINVRLPTIVGVLIFMSRINFIPSIIKHENSFITSAPGSRSKVMQRNKKQDDG